MRLPALFLLLLVARTSSYGMVSLLPPGRLSPASTLSPRLGEQASVAPPGNRRGRRSAATLRMQQDEFEDMSVLLKRMEDLRNEEESKSRSYNKNWMEGRCSHRTIAVLEDWVRKLKFHGDTVAMGSYQGPIYLTDMGDQASGDANEVKVQLNGHTDEVTALDFDGAVLASGSLDTSVRIWKGIPFKAAGGGGDASVHEQDECVVFHHKGAITGLQIAGRQLVSSSVDGTCRVWDLVKDRCERIIDVGESVTTCACSPEDVPLGTSRYLATGTESGGVSIFSMNSWKEVLSFKAHDGPVSCMWSDGQKVLVTGGEDGFVKVWDMMEGRQGPGSLSIKAHNAPVASLQADGTKIVSGGRDGAVRVWSKETGQGILEVAGHTAFLGSVQFEGHRLVTDGTNNVVVCHDFSNNP